ncbi:MAG: calcium-binding protein, partial [Pseudomonadota bacterium]
IEVRRSGSHMYLKDLTTGVESEILYQFHSTSTNYGMEEIQFADGTVWDRTAILNATNLAPIVFDLDGDGQVILTQSVAFDYNSDGDIELGSWMDAGDAVLALDRNGDDRITHGGEISFVDDLPGAMTDLEGLAAFDSNGDGVLSASDTSYGDFVLWTDKNGDAVSQLDELQGLESAGVSSLELSRTDDRSIDDSGNIIFGFATAIVGGADVAAGDVSFSFDTEASFDFDGIDDGPIATHSMEIQRIDFGGNENVVSDALGMTGSSFDSDFDFEAIFDPIPVEKEIYEGYLL